VYRIFGYKCSTTRANKAMFDFAIGATRQQNA
jgi:hypothetical protein